MGKQTKSKKAEKFGKGKVTPVQIAFIVDRYLSDNNYTQTRSAFRNEASDLIAKSPVQEAPKSLLSLGAMLDEYICLKEQKVMMDQDKHRLEQEKFRVQTLLRGMQDAMNAYNRPPSMVPSTAPKSMPMAPQIDLTIGPAAGHPSYKTPVMMSVSRPSNTHMDPKNFYTPVTNPTSRRRKGSRSVPDGPVNAKRSRIHLTTNPLPVKGTDSFPQPINAAGNQENAQQFSAVQSSPHEHDNVPNGSPVQGSSVAKCLFNQPSQSPPTNSSGPVTPLRATSSQTDKSVSPLTATPSNNVAAQQIISSNRTVITSETIRVSPAKQVAYYSIERNHRISSSSPVKTNLKRLGIRDHVKGRLDFDGSDMPVNSEKPIIDEVPTSQSNNDLDIFDFDLPNLDALGVDFCLSELLVDFDLDGEGINYSCQPASGSPDSLSGSQNESGDANLGANQVLSEFSSTVTEIFSENDMNTQGPDSVTNVKSITKCIQILSPAKNHTCSTLDRENLSARS
ncbi:uncharacterized protein LOC132313229 isoform X2 [Cornus florida]|uniref:uncharacterized protein LOC132313229 isoform X2 n=1 Tax=Cornus florida TaxID=4283 RepID=UPI00289FE5B9|nr:uncharacterized protein LOC132313229 isoform X2 [Cornus florida]